MTSGAGRIAFGFAAVPAAIALSASCVSQIQQSGAAAGELANVEDGLSKEQRRGIRRVLVKRLIANPRVLAALDTAHKHPERCLGNVRDLFVMMFGSEWGPAEVGRKLDLLFPADYNRQLSEEDLASLQDLEHLVEAVTYIDGLYRLGLAQPAGMTSDVRDIYDFNPSNDPEPHKQTYDRGNQWLLNGPYRQRPLFNRRYVDCSRTNDSDLELDTVSEAELPRSRWPRRDWTRADYQALLDNPAFLAAFEAASLRSAAGKERWKIEEETPGALKPYQAFERVWGRAPAPHEYGGLLGVPDELGLSREGYADLYLFLGRAITHGDQHLPPQLRQTFPDFYYGLN